jgi:hypothetical protein
VVIDFTKYDFSAKEPETLIRNWTLFRTLNQKQTRHQDRLVRLNKMEDEDKKVIFKRYPELKVK